MSGHYRICYDDDKTMGINKMEEKVSYEDIIDMSNFSKRKGVVLTVDEQHQANDIFVDMQDAKDYYVQDDDGLYFDKIEDCVNYLKQESEKREAKK